MATDDPYYTARDEVQRNIKKTKEMMQEWQVKLTSENTAKSKQFQDLLAEPQFVAGLASGSTRRSRSLQLLFSGRRILTRQQPFDRLRAAADRFLSLP
mmetsp:Transcript_10710/g.15110  ORF Transcript_10710/g.15110 Transcript_10710/m.15110 type:complete len:98 (-) Transcript_10710:13-306(-)